MDEADDRGARARAAEARARPHRGDPGRAAACRARSAARAARRRRRAQRHRTSTPTTCSACGSRRTSTTPTRYVAVPAAGRPRHAGPRLLPRSARRAWPAIRDQVPGAHRGRAEAGRHRRRRGARRADLRARDRDRRGALDARRVRGRAEGQQPLDARRTSHAKAPGLDWDAFFAAAGLAGPDRLRRLAAERGDRPLGAGRQPAARDLEGLPRASRQIDALRRPACPRRSSTSASASTARRWPARRSSATRWKRAVDATNAALGEAVGKLYVASATSRRRTRRAAEAMVDERSSPRSARASTSSTGWRRRPRREAKAKLTTLKVGVGYPDKWLDYSALEVVPRRRARQPASAPSCSSTAATSPSWASRSTAASG